ncbi:MAG TPA: FG-GAP repeat protein [Pyrinomonadaceae bacterium]|nr:FG-GAP repeat protein [Pyrinomonadaceae bacterium]
MTSFTGTWVETQKLSASDGEDGDFFGWSVAVSAATIIVGAPFDDINGKIFQGSAYIFEP